MDVNDFLSFICDTRDLHSIDIQKLLDDCAAFLEDVNSPLPVDDEIIFISKMRKAECLLESGSLNQRIKTERNNIVDGMKAISETLAIPDEILKTLNHELLASNNWYELVLAIGHLLFIELPVGCFDSENMTSVHLKTKFIGIDGRSIAFDEYTNDARIQRLLLSIRESVILTFEALDTHNLMNRGEMIRFLKDSKYFPKQYSNTIIHILDYFINHDYIGFINSVLPIIEVFFRNILANNAGYSNDDGGEDSNQLGGILKVLREKIIQMYF